MKRKSNEIRSRTFITDFKALELALSDRRRFPVERIVVELGLTARALSRLKRRGMRNLDVFISVYQSMQRHALTPRSRSWPSWLARYRANKKRGERALRETRRNKSAKSGSPRTYESE